MSKVAKSVYFLSGNGVDTWEVTYHNQGQVSSVYRCNISKYLQKYNPGTVNYRNRQNILYNKAKIVVESKLQNIELASNEKILANLSR